MIPQPIFHHLHQNLFQSVLALLQNLVAGFYVNHSIIRHGPVLPNPSLGPGAIGNKHISEVGISYQLFEFHKGKIIEILLQLSE